MLSLIVFHIFLAVVLLLIVNFLGKLSRGFGYQNVSDMLKNNVGFNLLFRILSPAVFIAVVSIILYNLNLSEYVEGIWWVTVYYSVLNFLILVLLNRLRLADKRILFLIYFASIGLSYFIYVYSLSRGPEYILPDAGDFRTEIWFIIILFFYKLIDSYSPSYEQLDARKKRSITQIHNELFGQHWASLSKEFRENKVLRDTLMSLMVAEDMNRPRFARALERFLFPLGIVKTTGIMQVASSHRLTDKESIEKAEEIILKIDSELPSDEKYRLPWLVGEKYNGGRYAKGINDVHYIVSSLTQS